MAENRANLKTVISADSSNFNTAMSRATARANSAGRGIAKGIGRATAGMFKMAAASKLASAGIGMIGGALTATAIFKGIKSAADLGGKVSDLASQTGIAAGNVLVMQRALESNGIAGDKLGSIINKLQKGIYEAQDGTSGAAKAFADLGLNVSDLMAMSPDKQFQTIQRAISSIQDPTKRAAMAMQIFGKSGGELLTLFADTGAFENAGKFVGTQADILNRSAGIFDEISDKLARIPDKLKGFFVGFLEPVSGALNGILDKFESFDFAASGLKLGESFMRAVEMFRGALDSLSIVEMFELAGTLLKVKLTEAGNEIFRSVGAAVALFKSGEIGSAMESAALLFQSVLFTTFSHLAKMLEEAFGPKSTIGKRLGGAAFSMGVQGNIAAKEREALNAKKENEPSLIDRFKEERSKIEDAFKIPDADIDKIETAFQKIRIAADVYTSKRQLEAAENAAAYSGGVKAASASTAEISGAIYEAAVEAMGPSKALMNPVVENSSTSAIANTSTASQSNAISKRAFKRVELQGAAGGLVTGGLGERRRLNTRKDDLERKKQISIEEQSLNRLEGIEKGINQALTVQ
jgi:hypothetical protein